ncbi:hypothetical protein Pcinc_027953 [Petrolisthes cinctipes]|uniref:C2H2-type domain-containing protein n=1 Tax=Petrolisthes cinctipes TaxID=88211 RepID=A0AAE1F324_PETCI|nr:hypothetical protein Pcinc_027953 [Petrolisthes cinctipes]
MAVRWSCENVVAEHRELQANAMALDWRGEYALLAGRRTLALIALDRPSEVVKRVSRTQQKYDVTAAEWNPIQSQGHTFVLASGERAEICQWNEGSLNGMTSLKAHTRTITDLNWHRSDPHLLATCSIDTFVHIWDTRETRKPVSSLSSIAGASQVKWNKLNQNFLASGHDSDIRVWDNRKPNQPVQYIAAHLSKIQGLDWSPNHENKLVTSSNDCTVKFFDITNPRKAENFINTLSPVWRARYTPFGEGVVTVVVPQLRRGENSLLLWSVNDVSSPVHTFVGHSDVVLEFEWQQQQQQQGGGGGGGGATGHHHLVTWARDHSLRIWKIDQQLQKLCGHDTEDETILGGESTDSEFANEAQVTQVAEAEDEVEKESEKTIRDIEGEEEPLSTNLEASELGENTLSQPSSISQQQEEMPECETAMSESTEKATQENSPETGSTIETCDSQMASSETQQTTNTTNIPQQEQPITGVFTEDNTASGAHPVPDLTNAKPSHLAQSGTPGPGAGHTPLPSTSTSAATQPMSLQQEFSLLNTYQDTSQVNSVEVVAGECGVVLADDGGCSGCTGSSIGASQEEEEEEPVTQEKVNTEEELVTHEEAAVTDEKPVIQEEETVTEDKILIQKETPVKEESVTQEETITNEKTIPDKETTINVEPVMYDETLTDEETVTDKDTVREEPITYEETLTEEKRVTDNDDIRDVDPITSKDIVTKESMELDKDSVTEQHAVIHKDIVTEEEPVTHEETVTEEKTETDKETVTEEEPVTHQETVTEEEPVTHQETVTEEEPVTHKETVTEEEPVTHQETVTEEEPVTRKETVTEEKTEKDKETGAEEETVTHQETVTKEEPVTQKETVTEEKTEKDKETVTEEEPVTHQDIVTEEEPVTHQDIVTEEEPVTHQETVTEEKRVTDKDTIRDVEPITDKEAVTEVETETHKDVVTEEKPVTHMDIVTEEKTEIDMETVTEEEPVKRKDTVTEEDTETGKEECALEGAGTVTQIKESVMKESEQPVKPEVSLIQEKEPKTQDKSNMQETEPKTQDESNIQVTEPETQDESNIQEKEPETQDESNIKEKEPETQESVNQNVSVTGKEVTTQEESVVKEEIVAKEESAGQEEPVIGKEVPKHEEAVNEEESVIKEDAIKHGETVIEEKVVTQGEIVTQEVFITHEETVTQEETAKQEKPIMQKEAVTQKESISHEEAVTQEEPMMQEKVMTQEDTVREEMQEEGNTHEEVVSQEETVREKEVITHEETITHEEVVSHENDELLEDEELIVQEMCVMEYGEHADHKKHRELVQYEVDPAHSEQAQYVECPTHEEHTQHKEQTQYNKGPTRIEAKVQYVEHPTHEVYVGPEEQITSGKDQSVHDEPGKRSTQGVTFFRAIRTPPGGLSDSGVDPSESHPDGGTDGVCSGSGGVASSSSKKHIKLSNKGISCAVRIGPGSKREIYVRKRKRKNRRKPPSESENAPYIQTEGGDVEESKRGIAIEVPLNEGDPNEDDTHVLEVRAPEEESSSQKAVQRRTKFCTSVSAPVTNIQTYSESDHYQSVEKFLKAEMIVHGIASDNEGDASSPTVTACVSNVEVVDTAIEGIEMSVCEDESSNYHLSSEAPGVTVMSLTPLETKNLEFSSESGTVKEEVVIHIDSNTIREAKMCPHHASLVTKCEPVLPNKMVMENNSKKILVKQPSTSETSQSESHCILNAAVVTSQLLLSGVDNVPVNVQAKLVYLLEGDCHESEFTEEVCATLAPQLLENNVLVHGENLIIFGQQAFLTFVEQMVAGEETLTQIVISPLSESMETYNKRGVNFVMIAKNFEKPSQSSLYPYESMKLEFPHQKKPSGQNAPNSDEPGIFQCDKCDKTYRVRSSLNSHKVTHNAEKMYKCDECDKAFHYSTPLQIHKRTHSDERPYKCRSCSATFRSSTNLRYHERLHTGERPIRCRECGQGFKDYSSLKRHKLKAHNLLTVKCKVCKLECDSVENLKSHLWQVHNLMYAEKVLNCDQCGEDLPNQKAYNAHMAMHKQEEKESQGVQKRLCDYKHQCGICDMTCMTKPQMLVHMQVHAAVKRFQCRYCKNAYMYRFMLAEHVRQEHPNEPQWFCQHCDGIFETCRKMNNHSCRAVRGDYICPHCEFQTEIRHRLFRHIIKQHPQDKTPYYCDFCKNSYEDPARLRYHQKREHPDKMLMLSMYRESTRQVSAAVEKSNPTYIDMSLVEMTIEEDTIYYHLPENLRKDDVFKERVKFKCYYCEAKFPVKNAMTRHILRAHPNERAYKCLICNIFLNSNIESKNHNRRYHRYRKTGGRDPLRNEKAMKKKAQMFEELKQVKGGSDLKTLYKFSCRYCSMSYKCKRTLIVHYKKWHPDEVWDYLPDKPFMSPMHLSKKKRKLLFFDCSFDKECQMCFDDVKLLTEHLIHAHSVSREDVDKHVKKRVVMENARRGRLPKNVVDSVGGPGRGYRRLGRKPQVKTEINEEEDVDDPLHFEDDDDDDDESESKVPILRKRNTVKDLQSSTDAQESSDDMGKFSERKRPSSPSYFSSVRGYNRTVDRIGSVRDVKKMLYRCRKCDLSFSNKSEYREHSAQYADVDCREFLHLNIKQEIVSDTEEDDWSMDFDEDSDDSYLFSSSFDDDDDEFDDFGEEMETVMPKKFYKKSQESSLGQKEEKQLATKEGIKKEVPTLVGSSGEGIHITTIDEDKSEDVLKIVTINASDAGEPRVEIKAEKISGSAVNFFAHLSGSLKRKGPISSTLFTVKKKNSAGLQTVAQSDGKKKRFNQSVTENKQSQSLIRKPGSKNLLGKAEIDSLNKKKYAQIVIKKLETKKVTKDSDIPKKKVSLDVKKKTGTGTEAKIGTVGGKDNNNKKTTTKKQESGNAGESEGIRKRKYTQSVRETPETKDVAESESSKKKMKIVQGVHLEKPQAKKMVGKSENDTHKKKVLQNVLKKPQTPKTGSLKKKNQGQNVKQKSGTEGVVEKSAKDSVKKKKYSPGVTKKAETHTSPDNDNPKKKQSQSIAEKPETGDVAEKSENDSPNKNKRKKCPPSDGQETEIKKEQIPDTPRKRGRPKSSGGQGGAEKVQCRPCQMVFKTRAELNFHMRYDH